MLVRRRPLMRAAMVGGTAYYAGRRTRSAAPTREAVDELDRLWELRARGVLSQDEFLARTRRVLGSAVSAAEARPQDASPIGPVQIVVLGFVEDDFASRILPELRRLRDLGHVRLLDVLVVRKDERGGIEPQPIGDLGDAESREFGALVGAARRPRPRRRGGARRGRPGAARRRERLVPHGRDPGRARRGDPPDRAPLGDPAPRRDRRGRGVRARGRVDPSGRPRRSRRGGARVGRLRRLTGGRQSTTITRQSAERSTSCATSVPSQRPRRLWWPLPRTIAAAPRSFASRTSAVATSPASQT